MKKYPCPKCGAKHSWFERDGDDLIQRCLCGLTNYLFREQEDGVTVMRSGVRVPDVTLPADGTKIRKCLLAVRNEYPKNIRTGDIASRTGLRGKETASLVVTLMGRGLLERVEARRGLLGGSVWKLTIVAQKLLKVDNKGVDNYGTSIGHDGEQEFLLERYTGDGGENPHTESGEFDDQWGHHSEDDNWP
jgi:hypothetical protein